MLRCSPPEVVVVVPVIIKDRVVQLIYAHAERGYQLPKWAGQDIVQLSTILATTYPRLRKG